jgi:hypothetical protein
MKQSLQLTSSSLHSISDIFKIILTNELAKDFSAKVYRLSKKDIRNFYLDKAYKKKETLLQTLYDFLFDYTIFKREKIQESERQITINNDDINNLIVQHIIANLELDFYELYDRIKPSILIYKIVDYIELTNDIEYTFYIKMDKINKHENTTH